MEDDPEDPPPSKASQLSKTPSWVMLGFVLGALAVYTLPRPEPKPVPAPAVATPRVVAPVTPKPPTVERAQFFEAVFAEYSHLVLWQQDPGGNADTFMTEVAFLSADGRSYSDCYEVLKIGDKIYFRSIPHLTRPVLTKGVDPKSPIQFTVPSNVAEMRTGPTFDEMNHGNFSGAAAPAPVPPPPVVAPPLATPSMEKPSVELTPPSGK